MDIALYAAVADNGVIGRDGELPWKLSSDLRRFKAGTMGKPVVMGRKTYESIGRPLPGRHLVVVSRDRGFKAAGIETAGSLDEALTLAETRGRCMAGAREICIVGGGEIYRQAIGIADRLYITHVLANFDGDTRFPRIDPAIWSKISVEDFPAGEKDSHPTRYVVYERRPGHRAES